MASSEHCGTEFSAKAAEDRFCCRGCEYVAELISEQGFGRFYDLTTVAFSMAGKMSPLPAAILMPLSSIASILIVATISREKSPNKG